MGGRCSGERKKGAMEERGEMMTRGERGRARKLHWTEKRKRCSKVYERGENGKGRWDTRPVAGKREHTSLKLFFTTGKSRKRTMYKSDIKHILN